MKFLKNLEEKEQKNLSENWKKFEKYLRNSLGMSAMDIWYLGEIWEKFEPKFGDSNTA